MGKGVAAREHESLKFVFVLTLGYRQRFLGAGVALLVMLRAGRLLAGAVDSGWGGGYGAAMSVGGI